MNAQNTVRIRTGKHTAVQPTKCHTPLTKGWIQRQIERGRREEKDQDPEALLSPLQTQEGQLRLHVPNRSNGQVVVKPPFLLPKTAKNWQLRRRRSPRSCHLHHQNLHKRERERVIRTSCRHKRAEILGGEGRKEWVAARAESFQRY